MSYSNVLATIALVVSVLTAAWTGWRAWRWDRPVISVSGEQWIGERGTAAGVRLAGFSIEVVNTGNQGTQIIAAHWEIDRQNGVNIRFAASHGGGGTDSLFEAHGQATAPSIPFTLGRYERRAWDFDMTLAGIKEPEGIIRCRPVVQFTSRKRTEFAYGPWQASQVALDARRIREEQTK